MLFLPQVNNKTWFSRVNPVCSNIQPTMNNPTSNYSHLHRKMIPVDIHRPGLNIGQTDSLNLDFSQSHELANPPHHRIHNAPQKSALGCWTSSNFFKLFGARKGLGQERGQDPQQKTASPKLASGGMSGTITSSEAPRPLPLESVLGRYQMSHTVVCPTPDVDDVSHQRLNDTKGGGGDEVALDRCFPFTFSLSVKPPSVLPTDNLYHDSPLCATSSLVHSHDEILPRSSSVRTPNEAWYEPPAYQAFNTTLDDKSTDRFDSGAWLQPYPYSPSSSSSSHSSASASNGHSYCWPPPVCSTNGCYCQPPSVRGEYEHLKSKWSPFDDDETAEYVSYADQGSDMGSDGPESQDAIDALLSDTISSSAFLSGLFSLPPVNGAKARYPPVAAPPFNTMTGLPDRGYKPYPIILAPVPKNPGLMRNVVEDLARLAEDDVDSDFGSDSDFDSESGVCSCDSCDLGIDEDEDDAEEGEGDEEMDDDEEEVILYMRGSDSDRELPAATPPPNSFPRVFTRPYFSRAPALNAGIPPLTTALGNSIWALHATERQQVYEK